MCKLLKIKNIKFNNHKILGNLEVDFLDRNKEILGTVVIIGENGSGKTTLLKSIYNLIKRYIRFDNSYFV